MSPPFYSWYDQISTGDADVSSYSGIVISVATDTKGNIYLLTLADGIKKYDPQGSSIGTYIPASIFNDPSDFEFNSKDELYVSDLNDREVKFFDSNGNYDPSKNLSSDYYKPYGVAVDNDDNVYIAEYNDGSGAESTPSSRIHIFYTNGEEKEFKGASNLHMDQPYRLDVDSNGYIYVAHAGLYPGVKIFGPQAIPPYDPFHYQGALPYVKNPGSIVIDDEDYVHIIDYKDRVNFIDIINYNVDKSDLQNIDAGIKNDEFKIRIFESGFSSPNTFAFNYIKDYDANLEMPLDLAFDPCRSKMYVNDLVLNYNRNFWVFSTLDFDLEFYNRTPPLDKINPYFTYCPSDVNAKLSSGENTYRFGYTTPVAADNCGVTVSLIEGQASGTLFEAGVHQITYEAVDFAGNTAICSFTFTLAPADQPFQIECIGEYTVELGYNSNSESVPVENFIQGDTSGIEFQIANYQFDCDDIGVQDLVINATKTATGETASCTVKVTVKDTGRPLIVCYAETLQRTIPSDGVYTLPQLIDETRVQDNCSPDEDVVLTQDPPAGTTYNQEQTFEVILTATDPYNNKETCKVNIQLTREEDTEDPVITCPSMDPVFADAGACGTVVEFDQPTATDNSGETPTITQLTTEFQSGDVFPVGTTSIEFQAKDAAGNTANCTVSITVLDQEKPTIGCPAEITGKLENGVYIIPDLKNILTYSDNCDFDLEFYQSIAPGTEITATGTVNVEFRVTDDSGNFQDCSLTIKVVGETLQLDCPKEYEVFHDSNCAYRVPDFSEIVTVSPSQAIIQQSIPPGTGLNYNEVGDITITATYNGQKETCIISLKAIDEAPVLACASDQFITMSEGESVSMPDYSNFLEVYNCGEVEIVQKPAAGTQISADTEVTFYVTDSAGREVSCSFMVFLVNENTLELACIDEYDILADDNCRYEVPDFSEILQYVPANAVISQSIEAGTTITRDTSITITATFEDQSASCEFILDVKDEIPPVISCPGDQTVRVNKDEPFILPDYRPQLNASDNCSDVNIIQIPPPNSQVYLDVQITFVATDEAGNSSSCHFDLDLVTEDQPPMAEDDEYTTNINETLNVAAPGILANDTDPDGDPISLKILTNTTANGSLIINSNGAFTYTPDPGFTGQDSFTYIATDGENDSGEATVIINVIDDSGEFSCVQQVVLGLGPEGEASLDIKNLYSGDAEGIEFSADKLFFTCDDIGENTVTLTYSGRLNGSCQVPVSVVDDSEPVLRLKDISIDLNLEGIATISFEDINDGSFDGCDNNVTYTLSKAIFTCKELGENTIQVTAKDSSGNITVATTTVKVFAEEGICSEPLPGSEYIFIYPNPNSGSFRVATPADVTIERIEVFDHRGRFVGGKSYSPETNDYFIDLGPLQEAVYVIKIVTNEGNIMKRMIFKN